MSATYDFDWRKSLSDFVNDMARLGINEIERIEPKSNEVQVDW